MKAFHTHRGVVVPLNRANIDTDQIIPKQFLKSICRTGFGEGLFFDWAVLPDGSKNPDFPLNREEYRGASILLVGNNFGCGSSREHAVWAVMQAGFQVVIAPGVVRGSARLRGFADIFSNNAAKNGLLTLELPEEAVNRLFEHVGRVPRLELTVELEKQSVTVHAGETESFRFEIDPAVKTHLLRGLDEIGLTLQHEAAIGRFEMQHNTQK
jgi:3-isopropylmalate/(R)-2-methylmalate dehydratase small subunit